MTNARTVTYTYDHGLHARAENWYPYVPHAAHLVCASHTVLVCTCVACAEEADKHPTLQHPADRTEELTSSPAATASAGDPNKDVEQARRDAGRDDIQQAQTAEEDAVPGAGGSS